MNKVKSNYIFNLIYQILIILIPIVTMPYVSRKLGVEGIGIYSYTLSIVTYFVFFITSIGGFGQREISLHSTDRQKCSYIFADISVLKIMVGIISTIVYLFAFVFEKEYSAFSALQLILLWGNILDVTWFFQGKQEFKKTVSRSIIFKIICTICIFIFVQDVDSLWIYILIMSLATFSSNIFMVIFLPKYLSKIQIRALNPFKYLKGIVLFFIPFIAIEVYTLVDKTMLHYFTGAEVENGYYEQATKIIRIGLTIITSLSTVKAPYISELYAQGKEEELKDEINKSFTLYSIIAIPICFGFVGIAKNFIPWYLGDEFDKCIILIYVFSPIVLFSGLSNIVANQYMLPTRQDIKYIITTVCAAILNISLNILLIPSLQSIGAAIASVSAELVVITLLIVFTTKKLDYRFLIKRIVYPIIASSIMLVCIYFMNNIDMNKMLCTFLQMALGGSLYFFILFILREKTIISLYSKIKNYAYKYEKRDFGNSLLFVFEGIMCILIILLHKQFPGYLGKAFSYLGSLGVTFFFLITGFSLIKYIETPEFAGKIKVRLKRNLVLAIIVTCFYIGWDLFIVFFKGGNLKDGLYAFLNVTNLLEFLLFNNLNKFGSDIGIMWYLWALVYDYLVLLLLNKVGIIKYKNIKLIFFLTTIVVSFVSISTVLFSLNGVAINGLSLSEGWLTRNWLFHGLPCILIGLCSNYIYGKIINFRFKLSIEIGLIVFLLLHLLYQILVYDVLGGAMASINLILILCDLFILLLCYKYEYLDFSNTLLCKIGRYLSRNMYLFHMVAIDIVLALISITHLSINMIDYFIPILSVIIALLICLVLSIIGNAFKVFKKDRKNMKNEQLLSQQAS